MAIVHDADSSQVANFSGTVGTSHVVGTLTNGILLAAVSVNGGFGVTTNAPAMSGANTGAMTLLGTAEWPDREISVSVYYKLAPTAGATTVAEVTTGTPVAVAIATTSYSGVNQTTTFGTPVANHADDTAVTVTVPTTAGDLVLDFVAWDTGGSSRTVTFGAGQTSRVNEPDGNAGVAISEETATGSSTVMSWTVSGTALWASLGVGMNAVGVGGATVAATGGSYGITGSDTTLTQQAVQVWFRVARGPDQIFTGATAVNDAGSYTIPALTRPAAGGSYRDPVFGTTIIRATDATVCDTAAVPYAYWPVWNLDMTKVWWQEVAVGGIDTLGAVKTLYDFNTTTGACTNRRALQTSFNLNPEGLIWSRATPNLLYGIALSGLALYSLVPGASPSQVVDLASRITAVLPTATFLWQMTMGGTDRYFAAEVRDSGNQPVGMVVYDLTTDTVYARDLTGITDFDEVHLTRDGALLNISTLAGARLWDFANDPTTPFTDRAFGQIIAHEDFGPSTQMVGGNSPEGSPSGAYAVWDLPAFYAGTKTADQASRIICNLRHASANVDWPALHWTWQNQQDHEDLNLAYLSNYLVTDQTAAWKPYFNEIWKVQTDGTGPGTNGEKVRRLAHHRSAPWAATDSYGSIPKGSVSTDGRWFAYTSDWGDVDRIGLGPWSRRDVYLLKIPTEAEFAAGRYL